MQFHIGKSHVMQVLGQKNTKHVYNMGAVVLEQMEE